MPAAPTAKDMVSDSITKADSYFYRPEVLQKEEEDIRKMNAVPRNVRRDMEALGRKADVTKIELEKVQNRKYTSYFTMCGEISLILLCGHVMRRGFRSADPMSSMFRDYTTNPFWRRVGNIYTVASFACAVSTTVYIPSDLRTMRESKQQCDILDKELQGALLARRELYVAATKDM